MDLPKKAIKTHQSNLRRLIKEERLQPSRRLMAEMLLLWVEGAIPLDLFREIWGNSKSIRWQDPAEVPTELNDGTKVSLEARDILAKIFAEAEENATDTKGK